MSSSSSTVVLITGANSGVGYATAKVTVSASADFHVIVGSRVLENGKVAVSELQAIDGVKGTISTVQIDVTDETSIKAAVAQIEKEVGHLDVLINNAALSGIHTMNVKERFEALMAANAIGPRVVSEYFRPLLLKSKDPRSIYVSSGLGSFGFASDPTNEWYHLNYVDSYRSSKAALNMIALQDHVNNGSQIKIFVMDPGLVRSNLRGKTEEARDAAGKAGDPDVSGRLNLDIIQGKRDSDVGKFVWTGGVYPW